MVLIYLSNHMHPKHYALQLRWLSNQLINLSVYFGATYYAIHWKSKHGYYMVSAPLEPIIKYEKKATKMCRYHEEKPSEYNSVYFRSNMHLYHECQEFYEFNPRISQTFYILLSSHNMCHRELHIHKYNYEQYTQDGQDMILNI